MASPSTYITIIKQFNYRNNPKEEFSNSYALSGSTPADSTAWRALFDALVLEEKKLYPSTVKVAGGYGYNKVPEKGDHAIWSLDLTITPNVVVPGTLTASGNEIPGDSAAWVRWGLDRYNSRGKRVYLRKYYHGGFSDTSLGRDVPSAAWTTALTAFGAKMRDGSFTGSRTLVSPPNDTIGSAGGEVPIGHAVSPYLTTRTLKRRGKRPPA